MLSQPEMMFYLLFIPHMLFALSIHEASHAGSAYLLGDDTAALMGRLTLNPLKHIDPMGLIAFFILRFGWAKPVPVNPLNFKKPRRDDILVSLAGPGSNVALGIVLLVMIRLILLFDGNEATNTIVQFLFVGARLNLALCFFNLIPIPPLDGSHVLMGVLPESMSDQIRPIMDKGPVLLIGLMMASYFLNIPIFRYLIWMPAELVMGLFLGI